MTRPPGDPSPDHDPAGQQPSGQPTSGQAWGPSPIPGERVAETAPASPPFPAPGLDAWGRPALEFGPAINRLALERASARLNTWLGVLMAVLLLGGVVTASAVFLGGWAGLNALNSLSSGVILASADRVLALAALLTLAWSAVSLGLVKWARELLRRLAGWALTAPQATAPDAARAEQLRRTLAGWLTFGQWGSVAGAVFGAALVPVLLTVTRRLTEQAVPAASSGLGSLGPSYLAFQTASSLVSAIPGVVIVWLILGAIRRFMNLAVGRARGLATAPLFPAAKVVGNWFLMSMILLGLTLLNLVVVGAGLAVIGGVGLSQLASLDSSLVVLRGVLAWAVPVLLGFLVFGALIYGLYFALLAFSRSYALSLGRLLDLGMQAAPSIPARPTGSAGEAPNVYKGY